MLKAYFGKSGRGNWEITKIGRHKVDKGRTEEEDVPFSCIGIRSSLAMKLEKGIIITRPCPASTVSGE